MSKHHYIEFYDNNPALMTLIHLPGVDEENGDILIDTLVKLANLSVHPTIVSKQISDNDFKYSISGLPLTDVEVLSNYIKNVGQYDMQTKVFTFNYLSVERSVFDNVVNEIERQLRDDRQALAPYFSMTNMLFAITSGLYQLTEIFPSWANNPSLGYLVEDLLEIVDDITEENIIATMQLKGEEIFQKADHIIAIAKLTPSTDDVKKNTLLTAYEQIKDMCLTKIKLLLENNHQYQTSPLDRHSNLFLSRLNAARTLPEQQESPQWSNTR